MNAFTELGRAIARARDEYGTPTVNTGSMYDGRLPGELAAARRMQTAIAALAEVRAEDMPDLLITALTGRLGLIGAERVLGDAVKGLGR